MQLSSILILLASTTGVIADLHKYDSCTGRFQPINNPSTCPKKRNTSDNDVLSLARSRIMGRGFGDNAAATRKACAAYRNRNTGNKQWDKCPDCTVLSLNVPTPLTLYHNSYNISSGWRHIQDPNYCVLACNSDAEHIGGNKWLYFCKQAGVDDADAY